MAPEYQPKANRTAIRKGLGTKYGSVRVWSDLCQRWFASKAEARRGEELQLRERVGHISDLAYQVKFILCKRPRVTITIDFAYTRDGNRRYEDVKGVLTRDFRTKMAWLKEKYGIEVVLERPAW